MHRRIQTLASCAILALVVGWILCIGKDVFIPIVFSIFVVYAIAGLARLLGKVPLIGPVMPRGMRYALSLLAIARVFVEGIYLVFAAKDSIVALAPRYQDSLLAAVQRFAVFSTSNPSRRGRRCARTCSRRSTCSSSSGRCSVPCRPSS